MALTNLNISTTNHSITINDTSGSDDPYCPVDTPLTRGTKAAACVVLLLFTFISNVLVIHIIRRNPTLRSTLDLLIVNMCVSNLFIPLFTIPYRIKIIYVGAQWIGGDLGSLLCKLVPFVRNVNTTVSILSMLAIAADRFRAIVYPMKATLLTASSCRRLIVLIWVLSALTYFIFFYTFSSRKTGTKTYCTQRWCQDDERDLKARKIHFTSQIALLIVAPLVLIIVLYTAVVVSLSQQEKRMASHFRSEPLKRRAKQNIKITFMLISVVVVFGSSYSPFGVWKFPSFFIRPTFRTQALLLLFHFSIFVLFLWCCTPCNILYVKRTLSSRIEKITLQRHHLSFMSWMSSFTTTIQWE